MARQRKNPESDNQGEFVCPECGRAFTRAASLGAHRRRLHGVVGSSGRSRARAARARTAAARNGRQRARTQSRNGSRGERADSRAAHARSVDRDALLQTLFPEGIPAKESVLESVNRWLEEAERLVRLR